MLAFRGGLPLYSDGGMPDLSQPLEVEIGLTGDYKHRGFSLSTKSFEEMIRNHADSGVDAAVDREHESWFGSTSPEARGWVQSLDIKPATGDKRKSALVAKVELNDLGQHAIANKHFRYVSMGIDPKSRNRNTNEVIGHHLDHLALVKHPYIQGMRPLSLSLSTKFGHMVEEEAPMEELAKALRAQLGLSADAPEAEIVAALATKNISLASAVAVVKDDEELKALRTENAEQKRIAERLEQALTNLTSESESRKSAEWKTKIDLAVKDFRLTPAEAKEHESLTGAERAVADRLLSLRTSNKPAPSVAAASTASASRTINGLSVAQHEAVEAFKKINPKADEFAALSGAALDNPALFDAEGVL